MRLDYGVQAGNGANVGGGYSEARRTWTRNRSPESGILGILYTLKVLVGRRSRVT